jgi:hypothetical protein
MIHLSEELLSFVEVNRDDLNDFNRGEAFDRLCYYSLVSLQSRDGDIFGKKHQPLIIGDGRFQLTMSSVNIN